MIVTSCDVHSMEDLRCTFRRVLEQALTSLNLISRCRRNGWLFTVCQYAFSRLLLVIYAVGDATAVLLENILHAVSYISLLLAFGGKSMQALRHIAFVRRRIVSQSDLYSLLWARKEEYVQGTTRLTFLTFVTFHSHLGDLPLLWACVLGMWPLKCHAHQRCLWRADGLFDSRHGLAWHNHFGTFSVVVPVVCRYTSTWCRLCLVDGILDTRGHLSGDPR